MGGVGRLTSLKASEARVVLKCRGTPSEDGERNGQEKVYCYLKIKLI
ncbi:hypothetical protein SAMD00020551_3161 [Mesobacillus selenatarsenatis SF-1]|uniref:Uncharacterized protein n=1 Tax=Mesobacillus selenatarsenatis (strain DSM 18680 / JCM 14380 / FERM P-15431 / SF-1) TaxID=1321606 RepID=A0A0A8X4W0_MESS1|nr:hypothetical protein SAMD00020551_3161 [Mesobacillus selenatarsenatis SF-1]